MNLSRRLTVLILIITVASVFLSSCGNALPISLSTVLVGNTYEDEENTIYLDVRSTKNIDFDMVQAGPSLLLLYMITTDDELPVTINFNNYSEMNHLNEDYWEDLSFPRFNPGDANAAIATYISDDGTVSAPIYPFKPLSGERLTNNFNYYLNFRSEGFIQNNRIYSIGMPLSFETFEDKAILTLNNARQYEATAYNPEQTNVQHIYVFAAITAQGLNTYVSDLTYIGEFTK